MDVIEFMPLWFGLMLWLTGSLIDWIFPRTLDHPVDQTLFQIMRNRLEQQRRLLQRGGGLITAAMLLTTVFLAHFSPVEWQSTMTHQYTLFAAQVSLFLAIPFTSLLFIIVIAQWHMRNTDASLQIRIWNHIISTISLLLIGSIVLLGLGKFLLYHIQPLISRTAHLTRSFWWISTIADSSIGAWPGEIIFSLLIMILLGEALIFVTVGRKILQQVLQSMPIPGFSSRTLAALQLKTITAGNNLRKMGLIIIGTGILLCVFLFADILPVVPITAHVLASNHHASNVPPHWQQTQPTIVPTKTPRATESSIAGFSGALQETDHGITISLTANNLHTGQNAITFDYRDSDGSSLPSMIPTIIVTMPTTPDGSTTISSLHIDTDIQGRHHAMLPFTHDGEWNIVIVVANPEQTITATVIFPVSVAP